MGGVAVHLAGGGVDDGGAGGFNATELPDGHGLVVDFDGVKRLFRISWLGRVLSALDRNSMAISEEYRPAILGVACQFLS